MATSLDFEQTYPADPAAVVARVDELAGWVRKGAGGGGCAARGVG